MTEGELMDQVRLIFGADPRCVLFRNNVGVAEFRNHIVRYGLAVGSADLIGMWSGRFLAIELKSSTGKQTIEQQTWQRCVERHGGVYRLIRSVDEARALLVELAAM